MTPFLQSLTMTYLLWPLLGLLLVGLGVFIAKKNALLGNKRLIGYFLGAVIVLTAPALMGFLNYAFMPYGYITLWLLYLILGSYHVRLTGWVFNGEYKYRHEFVLTLFLQLTAMLFFVLLFNLCNDLQYGLWASTSMLTFVFASLFHKTYIQYLSIPDAIYKIWNYRDSDGVRMDTNIDFGKLKVVVLELLCKQSDKTPMEIKTKIPDNETFGVWIREFMEDNNKKNPASTISYTDCGWIFYVHNSVFRPKRYIDPALSIKENRIKDNDYIVAKRVKEHITE